MSWGKMSSGKESITGCQIGEQVGIQLVRQESMPISWSKYVTI